MCSVKTLLSSHLTTLGFSKYQQPRVNRKIDERQVTVRPALGSKLNNMVHNRQLIPCPPIKYLLAPKKVALINALL